MKLRRYELANDLGTFELAAAVTGLRLPRLEHLTVRGLGDAAAEVRSALAAARLNTLRLDGAK